MTASRIAESPASAAGATGGGSDWQRAIELDALRRRGRSIVRVRDRQIAVFAVGDRVFACNNRCPHEGYPLVEGHVAGGPGADCVLTCNWHNWKFELDTGANVYGGDALRTYPTRIDGNAVWIDLADAPRGLRIDAAYRNLRQAMDDDAYDRIARELARLSKAGADPVDAVARAIDWSHRRLRDGATHAYAAAEAWLALYDELGAEADAGRGSGDDAAASRLTCLAEAIGHIAYDTLREPDYPYGETVSAWQADTFRDAVEAQDEDTALACVRGAWAQGLRFAELEPTLARVALAHYNDFGHSVIYLRAFERLTARAGAATAGLPLLQAYVRGLVRATREDLIPEFRRYADALLAWREAAPAAATHDAARAAAGAGAGITAPHRRDFVGASINASLAAAVAARGADPLALYDALLGAAAEHLLRFDARYDTRPVGTVAENIGWLDFTHGITFAHAVRETCTRHPALWPQGLLQMALMAGRNSAFIHPPGHAADAADAADRFDPGAWTVSDPAAFDLACRAHVLNHGVGLYIHSAHLLKTWRAARAEVTTASADTAAVIAAALNRYLHAPVRQKRTVRTARQAIGFVALED
jgi:nitrite reductase/ring-hydroxylating ferredoxin subunit